MTPQTPPRMRTALILCILGVASLLLAPSVPAQTILGTETGPTRTISWTLNRTEGLDATGIAIENETAVLEWVSENVNWSQRSHFVDNGTYDPTVSVSPSGIELAADSRNHITDGDFAAPGPGPWELLPTQNVQVEKEAELRDAFFGHSSSASANVSFDPLDTENDPVWTNTGSVGSTCALSWAAPGQNGVGKMIQCTIDLGSPPGSWAGVARTSANWSAYDRLLLWVFAENVIPLDWSFQLTAMAGLTPYATTPQLLRPGWQEIVVDLTELGPDREALTNVRFLVVGASISAKHVDFDDIRLANAKLIDETGRLRQNFTKPSATSSSRGSATLVFEYQVVEDSGVDAFDFRVNFSGENGAQEVAIPVISGATVTDYYVDVSSLTTAAGPYSIEFSVRIAINGVVASNASVRIDNVRVEFPNRRGGSFLSNVIDFALISQIPAIRWYGTIPLETAAVFRLRTGNESDPSGPTWGAWRTWDTPGPSSPGRGPSRYLQLGLDLDTTNASRTPVVHSVQVDARHRSATGSIETAFELHDDDFFGSWKLMQVHTTNPGDTGITLFVGRGGGWEEVRADGGLSQANSKTISWRVLVTTSNGVATPRLSSVVLTYERSLFPNSLASFLLSPYVLAAMLAVVVLGYSTRAVMRRLSFAVDDLFLISREGRLMMHNTRRMRPDRDEDILSGMLTAILAFVKDSDPEGNGELHHFKIGDKTTVVEKGMHSYVAAVYSGKVPRWAAKDLRRFLKDLEARFGTAFAQWSGDPEDLQGLQEFTARFVSRTRYHPSNAAKGRVA